jgi:hypothetical protein
VRARHRRRGGTALTPAAEGHGSDQDVDAALAVAAMGLREHQAPHMFLSAARLLDAVLSRADPQSVRNSPHAPQLAAASVDALGSVNAHVAEAATGLVTGKLVRALGPACVVRAVLRPPPGAGRGKKSSTLWRPLHARLGALASLVAQAPELCAPAAVLDWAAKMDAFEHANGSVRDAARDVVRELCSAHGFSAVELAVRERFSPRLADRLLASFASRLAPCVYCRASADEAALDLHYWSACAMLTGCPRCAQVVEVALLNDHLLQECEQRANHRACPRCHEAIAVQFFDQHVRRNACLEAKPKAVANVRCCCPAPPAGTNLSARVCVCVRSQRCPLCHLDVAGGEHGWEVHLLQETCVKNPRTPVKDT